MGNMFRFTKILLGATLLLLWLFMLGCEPRTTHFSSGSDGTPTDSTPPPPPPITYINEAWTAYNSGDFSQTATVLSDLRYTHFTIYQNYAPYWNISGWLEASTHNLTDANEDFTEAVELDSTYLDAFVGLAAVELSQGLYADCITSATTALSLNTTYDPGHDDLTLAHVQLLLAQAYVYNAELASALTQIQLFDPSFTVDLNHPEAAADLLTKIANIYDTTISP